MSVKSCNNPTVWKFVACSGDDPPSLSSIVTFDIPSVYTD